MSKEVNPGVFLQLFCRVGILQKYCRRPTLSATAAQKCHIIGIPTENEIIVVLVS
jgi:hypothetical protein